MINKTEFKALAKRNNCQFDEYNLPGGSVVCKFENSKIVVINEYDLPVLNKKYKDPDHAWSLWEAFLNNTNKEHDLNKEKIEIKVAQRAKTVANNLLKKIKGISLRNADDLEYKDAIDHLCICKQVLEGDLSEAYDDMTSLDTGSREAMDDKLYDLLQEWAD